MLQPLTLFKALADQTRLTSVLLIHQQQELCVCELMTALQETQPKISRHLALLRKQGILADRRQGQWVFYRLSESLPTWYINSLNALLDQQPETIQAALTELEQMGDRPERLTQCC
ncbi:MAG: metalloregulator ArsR/SmtB family transcription factor [Parashewanella sp.]